MDFKKRIIEELNLKGNNHTDLYQEYIDVCEKLAKEYHTEQCNIADVRESSVSCKKCGGYFGVNINHRCFKCLEKLF